MYLLMRYSVQKTYRAGRLNFFNIDGTEIMTQYLKFRKKTTIKDRVQYGENKLRLFYAIFLLRYMLNVSASMFFLVWIN